MLIPHYVRIGILLPPLVMGNRGLTSSSYGAKDNVPEAHAAAGKLKCPLELYQYGCPVWFLGATLAFSCKPVDSLAAGALL